MSGTIPAIARGIRSSIARVVLLAAAVGLVLTACGAPATLLTDEQLQAELRSEAGGDLDRVREWPILLQRAGGELERTALYVVRKPDGSEVLIDQAGERYDVDIDDFRAYNGLYGSDDTLTLSQQLEDPEAEFDTITVSGSITPPWVWWAAGGAGVLLLGGGAGWFLWWRARRRADREFDDALRNEQW
ncbi:hypothetical protein EV191_10190 [Tamaricihabitans halophyticus]|uniref:Uncharacterized protein n=1 Tax=Tamaricihabitans halophyticus TaxID=1262583 RepID=A0A4R2R0J5_9PSEU|nr:hypothetical protein [Tamaricihabitans halophyticus]TCP56150.1 hypothetical protein EV191_10190 [Tamaricihabitans halophyticus]